MDSICFIESGRLLIKALNKDEMLLELNNPKEFENQLHLEENGYVNEEEYLRYIPVFIEQLEKGNMDYDYWNCDWIVVLKNQNDSSDVVGIRIGSICFHGKPNDGEVEIGYGIGEQWQNKGFATEAVFAMKEWLKNNGIKTLLGCTDFENFASQQVLFKNGFELFKQDEEGLWYRCEL